MNPQLAAWIGEFGDEYTQRNRLTPELIQKRTKVLESIIKPLNPASVLEVGCNIGLNMIACLPFMRPPAVISGVEPNLKARRVAEMTGMQAFKVFPDVGQKLEFFDNFFDVVFTCGVLIHCELTDAEKIAKEMLRVARKYVFFMEYFNKVDMEIEYHGIKGLLWKRNWPEHFKDWGYGKQISCGFSGKEQGFDDVHWWVYKK